MSGNVLSLDAILAAATRLSGKVHRTPILASRSIGDRLHRRIYLKAELFQRTGSFKIRGVLNTLGDLTPDALSRGLISMSAGNHAQALACGAGLCGTRATVVMPARAVPGKIEATRGYGGEVVLTDGDLMERVETLGAERGLTLVHPFDDMRIMAGHGTVGLEILDEIADPDAVVVPIGGGGLIGGVAAAIKQRNPRTRVVGVEPRLADAMSRALAAGQPVPIGHPETVADGLAAPFAGARNLAQVQRFVDDVVRVDEASIVEALRWLVTRTKLAAEPSGAAPLAALLEEAPALRGMHQVVCVVSGGNVDPARLAALIATETT